MFATRPVMPVIDERLAADQSAPRKQRHTSARIHKRLQMERPEFRVAQLRVRGMSACASDNGMRRQDLFIPQTYPAAGEPR